MNEQIRELAEQAGFNEYILENVWLHEQPEFYKLLEKFAELIVLECAGICDQVETQYGQYTFTARECKNRFKQHFGVEK
jgi:hypothetical protein